MVDPRKASERARQALGIAAAATNREVGEVPPAGPAGERVREVVIAARSGELPHCGHLATPQITVCAMRASRQRLECATCARAHRQEPWMVDSHCDACMSSADHFRETIVQVGGLLIFGNICDRCWTAAQRGN